jgi:formate dehydrogenase subunit gamma
MGTHMGIFSVLPRRLVLALLQFALPFLLILGGGTALAQQDAQAQQEAQAQAQAQRQQDQPGNNAPVWREVRKSEQEHYTSVKGRETGVLIHSAGETWRELRNGWIVPVAGWLLVAAACVMGLFHLLHGPVALEGKPTGRLIQRFTALQRVAHWSLAISFCILAVTGLIMLVGKHVLLPIIGHTLFAWLADIGKLLHNFVGPVFAASVVLMFFVFIKGALPAKGDLKWLIKAGGAFEGKHMPVGKHHAGHKVWFWGSIVVMSTIISASGLVMDFPTFDQTRSVMIVVNIVHGVAGGLLMALSLTHIYMGTVGVQGAYEGMRYGYVDETYAKEHHVYWYEDVKSGKVKADTARGTPEAPQGLERVGEPI